MKRLNWILSTPRALVFAGLLVLVLLALLWAAAQRYQSGAVQAAEVTADWPVYENLDHGFRIKYPPQWTYIIYGPISNEILFGMSFYDGTKYQPGVTREEFPRIALNVLYDPQRLSLDIEAWAKAHLSSSPAWFEQPDLYTLQFESYEIVRTLNIAGVQAIRLVYETPDFSGRVHAILIPQPDEGKIIALYYWIETDPPTMEVLFELLASTVEAIR